MVHVKTVVAKLQRQELKDGWVVCQISPEFVKINAEKCEKLEELSLVVISVDGDYPFPEGKLKSEINVGMTWIQ